jgi:hypothetical protein
VPSLFCAGRAIPQPKIGPRMTRRAWIRERN